MFTKLLGRINLPNVLLWSHCSSYLGSPQLQLLLTASVYCIIWFSERGGIGGKELLAGPIFILAENQRLKNK